MLFVIVAICIVGFVVCLPEQPSRIRKFVFTPASSAFTWNSNEQSRVQWNANQGYCGETSVQTALLRFGAWMSVFDVRAVIAQVQPKIVNPSLTAQQQQQLLIGENDQATAAALSLRYEEYSAAGDPTQPAGNTKTADFLAWMKKQARQGFSVSFGVFTSSGKPGASGGQQTYDHIVSYASIQSNYNDDLYHADDILCFNDWYLGPNLDGSPYCYAFSDTVFVTTRTSCDASGLVWCLPDAADPETGGNYGIAYKGSADAQAFPVSVVPSSNVEGSATAMPDGSNDRPALLSTTTQTLTLTVSGLTAGAAYKLYQFNSWNVAGSVKTPQGGNDVFNTRPPPLT